MDELKSATNDKIVEKAQKVALSQCNCTIPESCSKEDANYIVQTQILKALISTLATQNAALSVLTFIKNIFIAVGAVGIFFIFFWIILSVFL